MTSILKNAEIKFENITFINSIYKGNKLISSYFGKEVLLHTPLLKWYLQQGFKITKFDCAIKYTPEKSFQRFADEVSGAISAGDIDDSKKLIA